MTILIVEGAAKVYRREGNIAVSDKEGNAEEASIPDLELVVVIGERVFVTSSALITLISNGIPVVFVSGRLDVYGVLYDVVEVGLTNIREVQYSCFSNSYCRARYAKSIVFSKIRGLYNTLRYEYKYYKDLMKDYDDVRIKLLEVMESVEKASDIDELRALEALGSKYFWNVAVNLIPGDYGFTGREPRKGDVINSAIDFLYAILYGIVTKAIVSNGLDPFCGLIHTSRSGRISLTYDLSELFKPIVVHSVIQESRVAKLKTFRGSRLLKPKTIETLTKHLYYRLSKETEKIYKRKSIWQLPIRETNKFKETIMRRTEYKPYIYDPTS